MRTTAYGIILFFICLNLSLYFMNVTQVLGAMQQSPYSTPTDITGMFISLNPSRTDILTSAGLIGMGLLLWLGGGLVFGAATAILIGVLNLLIVPVKWAIGGLPDFLYQLGASNGLNNDIKYTAFVTIITAGLSLVWFWFFISFLSQREIPTA